MTTEPTDAELDEVLCGQWPAFSMQATLVRMWVRQAMRAAVARWGQPSGAGEPVASVHRDTLAMLNSGQAQPWDRGARLHPPSKGRFNTAYAPLYAAPPTAQAGGLTWTVFNSGAQVAEVESLAEAMEYLTPARLARQWCAVCVVDQSNLPPTSAEGVEHADQA